MAAAFGLERPRVEVTVLHHIDDVLDDSLDNIAWLSHSDIGLLSMHQDMRIRRCNAATGVMQDYPSLTEAWRVSVASVRAVFSAASNSDSVGGWDCSAV